MSSTSLQLHRPEHLVQLEVEQSSARDAIKGILHTIFFHRLFAAIRPITRDVLALTLPAIDDPDLESLIHDRATSLVRLVHNSANRSGKSIATADTATTPKWSKLRIRFHEKRRKKASYSFFGRGAGNADEQVCWEAWTVAVRLLAHGRGSEDRGLGARPAPRPHAGGRRRGGAYTDEGAALFGDDSDSDVSRRGSGNYGDGALGREGYPGAGKEERARLAAETSLREAMMNVIDVASKHKDHIPPIMSTDENPFPYDIVVLGEGGVGSSDEEKASPAVGSPRRVPGGER